VAERIRNSDLQHLPPDAWAAFVFPDALHRRSASMMSLSAIRQLSRDFAIRACRENKIPFVFEQSDIDDLRTQLQAGKTLRFLIPFLGNYIPQGWRHTDRPLLFVDTSGFGREDEPALTTRAFVEAIEPGKAYAVVETGQFQAYLREYERDDASLGNENEFVGLTSDEEQEFNEEFRNQEGADVEIRFEGTIALFEPLSHRASAWIQSHVLDDAQWFGNALVVEHHFVKELARAMKSDGLRLS
jgi:hypothetical protein